MEDAKHPNLKQHPIRFLSDDREGKLIPLPIEELVNRSFLLPIKKDSTRRRAAIKDVDSKAYQDYMNHISSLPQEIALQNNIWPYKRYYSLHADLAGTDSQNE